MVVAAVKDEVRFGPNDLSANLEACGFDTFLDARPVQCAVKHVHHIASEQLPDFSPVPTVIIRDSPGARDCSEACLLPPVWVELDTVWLIRDQVADALAGHEAL